jgi:ribosomal subunit interface protein
VPFRVSGKNLHIGEALRARVEERVRDATATYFDGGFSGHVTIAKDGFGFRTECVIHLDSGIVLETEALAADAYASADKAAVRLEKRLRRYKRRLKDHQAERAEGRVREQVPLDSTTDLPASADDADEHETEFNPVIIAESLAALKRLSVSDAVAQLDACDAPVVVFRHAGHGRVNLVYRRPDGHIGWIDLPVTDEGAQ